MKGNSLCVCSLVYMYISVCICRTDQKSRKEKRKGPLGERLIRGAPCQDWMHTEVEVCECLTLLGFDFYFRCIDSVGAPLARRGSTKITTQLCKIMACMCSFFRSAAAHTVRQPNEYILEKKKVCISEYLCLWLIPNMQAFWYF